MQLTMEDLDRIENCADRMDGAAITYDEQMELVALAREALKERDRYIPVAQYNKKAYRWEELEVYVKN